MDVCTVNALLEHNARVAARNDFRLCYDSVEGMRQAVIARGDRRALTIGHGVCGVGMMWVDDAEAKGLPGYGEALRLADGQVTA